MAESIEFFITTSRKIIPVNEKLENVNNSVMGILRDGCSEIYDYVVGKRYVKNEDQSVKGIGILKTREMGEYIVFDVIDL